jgi:hypothetical protein
VRELSCVRARARVCVCVCVCVCVGGWDGRATGRVPLPDLAGAPAQEPEHGPGGFVLPGSVVLVTWRHVQVASDPDVMIIILLPMRKPSHQPPGPRRFLRWACAQPGGEQLVGSFLLRLAGDGARGPAAAAGGGQEGQRRRRGRRAREAAQAAGEGAG